MVALILPDLVISKGSHPTSKSAPVQINKSALLTAEIKLGFA
jgi:hypothetical protein